MYIIFTRMKYFIHNPHLISLITVIRRYIIMCYFNETIILLSNHSDFYTISGIRHVFRHPTLKIPISCLKKSFITYLQCLLCIVLEQLMDRLNFPFFFLLYFRMIFLVHILWNFSCGFFTCNVL